MSEQDSPGAILVADDTVFFRTLLLQALRDEGYSVEGAEDGAAAWDMLKRSPERYALALLDLVMPKLNGLKLLEKLREEPALAQLPVLVLSQFVLNDLERGILKHHRARVVPKSASIDQILFAVFSELHPEASNERRHARAPLQLPLTVHVGDRVHHAQCFNLSQSGMFVVVAEDVAAEGSAVKLKFWVPGAAVVLEVDARVAWINRSGQLRRSHPPGFGVELIAPSPEATAAIASYLETQGQPS